MAEDYFFVTVVYASEDKQSSIEVKVDNITTVKQAIEMSGILQKFPEIDLQKHSVGIYSKKVPLNRHLHSQDRIEIYRPLMIDPKEARRKRI